MRLKGRVCIITGGKSGIGFATAVRFAAEGAKVVVADFRDARQEVETLVARGGEALFVQADVRREAQVRALVERTLEAYGRLDVLVNNAGIGLARRVTETSEEEWDRVLDTNLKGVFLCSRAAIPAMQRAGGGVIVNVASELGLVGGAEMAAYCASKGGVVQLTRAMALEYAAEGIRVNCVCPGPVATPFLERLIADSPDPEEERRAVAHRAPLGRLAQPEDVANVLLFLASDESRHITGAAVTVDGGWTAR